MRIREKREKERNSDKASNAAAADDDDDGVDVRQSIVARKRVEKIKSNILNYFH